MGLRSFLVLHRRMGLVSALFVLLLSITGLLLHYTNALGLDQSSVGSPMLLKWYGIEAPQADVAYEAGGKTIVQIERSLFLGERRLAGEYAPLVGIAAAPFGFVIATGDELLLTTEAGELIEVLATEHGLPLPITGLASDPQQIVLRGGGSSYSADLDALEFSEIEGVDIVWSEPVLVSQQLAEQLAQQYAASLISWERVLLDLHSGQLFGALGRIIVDVMAVLFILMALTGVWIWSRRRP